MRAEIVVLLIPIIAITGGLIVGALAIINERRQAQLRSEERRLMIEKGMVPPPDPNTKHLREVTPMQVLLAIEACLKNGVRMVFLGIGLGLAYLLLSHHDAQNTGPGKLLPAIGVAALIVGLLGIGNLVYYALVRHRKPKID